MLNIKEILEFRKTNPEPKEVTKIREKILSTFNKLQFVEETHQYFLPDTEGNLIEYDCVSNVKEWNADYFSDFSFSDSFIPVLISSSILALAELNSRMPFPRPRISSGIFLPPKSNKTTRTIRIISCVPMAPNITEVNMFNFFKINN